MSDQMDIDPKLVETYRQRRAPPGFAARVVARASARARAPVLGWRSAVAIGTVAGAALVYLLVWAPSPPEQAIPNAGVPPAPDYWVDISIPRDLPVSGMLDIGAVPPLPARPDFDMSIPDRQSMHRPRITVQVSHSLQQETIHEAI